ncbi:hypothetical protein KUTeg_001441 [Tegillarca granosa]|uniref:Uncharacterized protein n=1 Tax=Tegillarca granosa TaxID=220873 RepID=A0ABQ9FRE8_TEGGR|nr:hypothetical protein KUTeg_001441 [Tegillarca granosa]
MQVFYVKTRVHRRIADGLNKENGQFYCLCGTDALVPLLCCSSEYCYQFSGKRNDNTQRLQGQRWVRLC